MCSSESLREFVTERLTAAAEEIFRVFEKTIVEYEEEIDRQRRLLDLVWKPEIKLQKLELPQQNVLMEESAEAEQQLCNQERNSSLDREDPDPPQVKEEQEELFSQEGEQLVLKQETDTFTLIPTHEESDHSEPEPVSEHQLLSHSSPVTESEDREGDKHVDSGSTGKRKPQLRMRHCRNTCTPMYHSVTNTDERVFKCYTCGKAFNSNSNFQRHLKIHTGERPYVCYTCEKPFNRRQNLERHMKIHRS